MQVEQRIRERIMGLVQQAPTISAPGEFGFSAMQAQCIGWISAADNIVALVCSNQEHPYRKAVERAILSQRAGYTHVTVSSISGILSQLIVDINQGLLLSVENEARAETYDDLLDHAEAYLSEGRKEPAGAITGVVFEDTLRRLCRVNDIDDEDKTCEPLINALASRGTLTKMENKEAKAAADLRASATHARWDEFNAEQVDTVIRFTRRLIREKL